MDCSKPITDLTPSEAWQCFWQADDWRIIAANLRHVWAGFIGTTIGEWGEIILALAMLPAQFASYAWPFILLRYMIIRSRAGYIVPQWFGAYMVAAGGFSCRRMPVVQIISFSIKEVG